MAAAGYPGHILLEHHGESGPAGEDVGGNITPHVTVISHYATVFPAIHTNSGISDMVLRLQVSTTQLGLPLFQATYFSGTRLLTMVQIRPKRMATADMGESAPCSRKHPLWRQFEQYSVRTSKYSA